jgi:hypothetical protein
MGDSSEETKIGRDRKEAILRCRLRMQGHALRRKGPGDCERPRAIITPLPARERTDVAPDDVAIELHTSGAIDRASEQHGIVPKLSDQG